MAWGGVRPNAGRKPVRKRRSARKGIAAVVPEKGEATRAPPLVTGAKANQVVSAASLMQLVQESHAQAAHARRTPENNPFRLPEFPPHVMPPTANRMAMDSNMRWGANAWLAGTVLNGFVAEGLVFPGYSYLAELTQRPEYRIMSETIADDATRKWIKFEVTGDEDEIKTRQAQDFADPDGANARRESRLADKGKTDKVKALKAEMERLDLRDHFYAISRDDGFYGRTHLFMNFAGAELDNGGTGSRELRMPIGDGRGPLSQHKIEPGSLLSLKVVEPIWVYPTTYNAINPLRDDWYNPQVWYVMGQEVHTSRLMPFVSRPVPDILKPAYAFGGLSLSQIAEPYVDIWLQTRASVATMIKAFSVMVLKTDLSTLMQPGSASGLMARVAGFNAMRDNQGTFVVNKETEDFANVSAPLSGLDHLQAQSQEHMCVPAGTMIRTARGDIAIERVTTADRVRTRSGFFPVKWAGVTKVVDTLVEIEVDGAVLRTTSEHPIWSQSTNGFVSARNVSPSHRLLVLDKEESTASQLHGVVDGGGELSTAITATKKLVACSTEGFGRPIAALSRPGMKFITSMKTQAATIGRAILNSLLVPITCCATAELVGGSQKFTHVGVPNVDPGLSRRRHAQGSVAEPAKLVNGGAVTRAGEISVDPTPVYDIEVDGPPEFFANGILIHNSSVSRIPLVKLTGISPSGLNASSEGEIRVYYDTIAAYQNRFFRPNLTRLIGFMQLNLWGEVDPEITFEFEPLWEMSQKEKSEKEKADAERHGMYVDQGVIAPDEVRQIVIDDPTLPYTNLNPDDVPDLAEEEEEGLMPGGKKKPGGEGGEGGDDDDDPSPGAQDEQAGFAFDEFREDDHPRADNGQFGTGGSSGKARAAPKRAAGSARRTAGGSAPSGGFTSMGKAPLKVGELKKVGGQLGSNPGGVFEAKDGTRYYIKDSHTVDHARSELLAANLYDLAGAPTLNYRAVDGGGRVATEWQTPTKKSGDKFTPEEVTAAQENFAVHAWLANWDAAGLSYDNQAIIEGRPTTVDVGGSLSYRAQGGPKGAAWGDRVGEWATMRDPNINPQNATMFGKMTPEQLRASAKKVTGISDDAIRAAVKANQQPDAMADRLIARRDDIAKKVSGAAHDDAFEVEGGEMIEVGDDLWIMALDEAQFEESKHKRDSGGKFSSTGGGGASSNAEGGEGGEQKFKSKAAHVGHLLQKGTTIAEILKVTGWPSVSVPAQAKAAGLKLEKIKGPNGTTYKGVPMTDAEKAEAKKPKADPDAGVNKENSEFAQKLIAQAEASIAKKDKPPQASPEDLKKAAKATDVPTPPGFSPAAKAAILKFNDQYGTGTPTLTDPDALNKKVADWHKLKAETSALNQGHSAQQAALAAEKQAKAKAKAAQANAELMKDPNFAAVAGVVGVGTAKEMEKRGAANVKAMKEVGVDITVPEGIVLAHYIGAGYASMNIELYEGVISKEQFAYRKALEETMKKMPVYKGKVMRGVKGITSAQFAKYKPNHIVPSPAFQSAGKKEKLWGEFTLEIHGSSARDLSAINPGEGGGEVVFLPHTSFHVKSNNGKYAVLEEV